MQIAVLTFDGFNELDSFIAAAILNRLRGQGWAAHITAPTARVTSMNGVTIDRQKPLEYAEEADAVIVGSGVLTREIAADTAMLDRSGSIRHASLSARNARGHCCSRSWD